MKKILIFIFLLIPPLCSAQFFFVQEDTSFDTTHLNLMLTQQNPFPAEPGKTLNIEAEVQNNGYKDVKNLIMEIIPKDPFILLPGENKTKTIRRINAQDSVKISYTFKINDSAVSGEYKLEFRFYFNYPYEYITKEIKIKIQGRPEITLNKIETVPKEIQPGDTVRLNVKIKNTGTGTAKDIELKFSSDSDLLIPSLSGGVRYLGDIPPGNEKTGELLITIDPDAEYKTYKSKIILSYKDESGEIEEKEWYIGIPVKGVIKIEIIDQKINVERKILEVQIANKGTADARAVEAKLFINGKLIGVDYTSQLKSTRKTTLDFPLMSGKGYLIINYTTPDLKEESIKKDILITYKSENNNIMPFLFLGCIFGGYFIIKRIKKKKGEE